MYCTFVTVCYLVGVVHEVDWDAEWQRMVVGVSQQDGDDLHTRRFGLPLSILQCSLHRPLTVHCILPHLTPVRAKKRYRNVNNALNNCLRTGFSYFVVFPATLERNHGSATGFRHLTLGLHCVEGTVSGTKGSVVEEGTEPHTETTAASTTGRGGKRRKTLIDSESLIFYAYIFVKIRKIKQIHPLFLLSVLPFCHSNASLVCTRLTCVRE